MKMELQHFTSNLANSPIRREKLHGRSYVVAPMAMLAAGVHNGSNGALLYEDKDIAQAVPAWNMKPIVVYHPTINNQGATAADPDILERQQVGMIMNTAFAGGKLRAEAWIEEDLANKVDNRVMEALENNRMMEISTGLFTTNEPAAGTWNNEDYTSIARAHQPDHLALLPDQIGAFSIADGGGLLQLNAEGGGFEGADVMAVARRIVGNKMSHSNIYSAIATALAQKVPTRRKGVGEDAYSIGPWVVDVYDTFFIYEMEGVLYRLHYTNSKAGVEITGDADEVVRVTEYRTADTGKFVGNNQSTKTTDMKKNETVDGLIANADTQWGEEDREVLMALDEKVLNKMSMPAEDPKKKKKVAANADEPDATKGSDEPKAAAPAAPAAPATANTAEAYINGAPPEIQQVLRNGLAAHAAEQNTLIEKICANAGNTFTKEFLATKGLDELRGIAALAAPAAPTENQRYGVPMFTGAATPAGPTANTAAQEEVLMVPVMNFGNE